MFPINMSQKSGSLALLFLNLCVFLSGSMGIHENVNSLAAAGTDDPTTASASPASVPVNGAAQAGGLVNAAPASASADTTVSSPKTSTDPSAVTSNPVAVTSNPVAVTAAPLPTVSVTNPSSTSGLGTLQDATGKSLVFPITDSNGRLVLQSASDIRPSSASKAENMTSGSSTGIKLASNTTDVKGEKTKKGAKGGAGNLQVSLPKSLMASISLGVTVIIFA